MRLCFGKEAATENMRKNKMKSIVRDMKLAPSGHDKIAWVKNFMPVLNKIEEEYSKTKPFKGCRMVLTIHLEAKTAYLAKVLKNAGAEVTVTGSNPLSTQDDVAAALVEDGVNVFATHACTDEEYDGFLEKALVETKPNIIVDDGGATTREGVYAGGDAVTGSATVISAMGAGKLAAASIHRQLSEKAE